MNITDKTSFIENNIEKFKPEYQEWFSENASKHYSYVYPDREYTDKDAEKVANWANSLEDAGMIGLIKDNRISFETAHKTALEFNQVQLKAEYKERTGLDAKTVYDDGSAWIENKNSKSQTTFYLKNSEDKKVATVQYYPNQNRIYDLATKDTSPENKGQITDLFNQLPPNLVVEVGPFKDNRLDLSKGVGVNIPDNSTFKCTVWANGSDLLELNSVNADRIEAGGSKLSKVHNCKIDWFNISGTKVERITNYSKIKSLIADRTPLDAIECGKSFDALHLEGCKNIDNESFPSGLRVKRLNVSGTNVTELPGKTYEALVVGGDAMEKLPSGLNVGILDIGKGSKITSIPKSVNVEKTIYISQDTEMSDAQKEKVSSISTQFIKSYGELEQKQTSGMRM
ncbi:hypothetical protein [Gluconobacter cerinus]|uniref:hypothetical protein n=1 Tax=Gluconobacter cerinus TaxID=38307 RepID=UPI001B8B0E93|nr:hypothetical protein [Gluconobacter cerinus]MBS1038125.1 hypothetical protein [Gluconobacter cerinus]